MSGYDVWIMNKSIEFRKKLKNYEMKTKIGCSVDGRRVPVDLYDIAGSSNSNRAIIFTFGIIPLGKVWIPLLPKVS